MDGGVPSLCPLGAPESIWFSGVFGGYRIGTLARGGSSTGNKYISAIKLKIQVQKKKSIADTEKDEKVL